MDTAWLRGDSAKSASPISKMQSKAVAPVAMREAALRAQGSSTWVRPTLKKLA